MDDQGFDFTPVRKEAPKRFEPPPWELEAFEELKRKQQTDDAVPPEAPERQVPRETNGVSAETTGRAEGSGVDKEAAGSVSEAQVLEMLAALAEEDPTEPRGLFAIGVGAGLVLVAIGGVLILWAMAALVGSARTGWMGQVGGTGIGLFGVFFLGMGVWMIYRTLKRRGVL